MTIITEKNHVFILDLINTWTALSRNNNKKSNNKINKKFSNDGKTIAAFGDYEFVNRPIHKSL